LPISTVWILTGNSLASGFSREERLVRTGALGRGLALAAAVLIATAALCLYHGDSGPGEDLCLSMIALGVTALALFLALPDREPVLALVPARRLHARDLPAPPPKA
jgi:hypothetical protein